MADEYINKTELLFEMATSLIPQSMDITMGYAIAKDLIRKAPTADVVPVVHGEWKSYPSDAYMKCSVCEMEYLKSKMPQVVSYCPNCGAKLDGGNE